MNDPTTPGDLARWLERATHGLPHPAAGTIREELAAHVEDATDEYIQQGLTPDAARRCALAELGDPYTAAHGFSDVYRGRRTYIRAMLASLLLVLLEFVFHLMYAALDITDYSTSSRFFYVITHIVFMAFTLYVVFSLRRLLTWRFDNQAVITPSKVILGGAAAYLIGNLPLELTVATWDPVPTLRTAAGAGEWLGLLFMHGGMMVIYAGVFWMGLRALSTRNGLVKGTAVMACILSADSAIALILWYLDIPISYVFAELSLVFGFFLWPLISLLFFQAIFTYRHLPAQTA